MRKNKRMKAEKKTKEGPSKSVEVPKRGGTGGKVEGGGKKGFRMGKSMKGSTGDGRVLKGKRSEKGQGKQTETSGKKKKGLG